MLIFNNSDNIDINKPIFGLARRKDEKIYKISGRAHEILVEKGLNLSKAIRTALELSNINSLGGGHPPAAGTKIPIEKTDIFLKNIDKVIKNQLKK
jgi:single-stranded DNA-specific DHH superfamily exonuclease